MKKIFFLSKFFLLIAICFIVSVNKTYAQADGPRLYFETSSALANLARNSQVSTALILEMPSDTRTFSFDIKLIYDTTQIIVPERPFSPSSDFGTIDVNSANPPGSIRFGGHITPISGPGVSGGIIRLGTMQFKAVNGTGAIRIEFANITEVAPSRGAVIAPLYTPLTYSITSVSAPTITPPSGPTSIPSPTPVPDTDNGDGTCRTANGMDGLEIEGLGCVPTNPAGFAAKFYSVGLGLIGGIAVLFLMYGGYLLTVSSGDVAKVSNGRSYIMYAIIGLLFAVFGYVFIQVVIVNILHVPGFS